MRRKLSRPSPSISQMFSDYSIVSLDGFLGAVLAEALDLPVQLDVGQTLCLVLAVRRNLLRFAHCVTPSFGTTRVQIFVLVVGAALPTADRFQVIVRLRFTFEWAIQGSNL